MRPDISFHSAVNEMTIPEVEKSAIDIWHSWEKWGRGNKQEIKEKLEYCLRHRKKLLNDHYQLTNQDLERFRIVANLFAEKTEMIFRNTRRVYKQLHAVMKNGAGGDFSDFYIEASIQVCYNDTDSIVPIEDDSGSDYMQFAEILGDICDDNAMPHRLDYNADATLDDKFFRAYFIREYDEHLHLDTTRHVSTSIKFPELLEIPMCYALYRLSYYDHYSFPDIIRINDVWSEMKVSWQNIYNGDCEKE